MKYCFEFSSFFHAFYMSVLYVCIKTKVAEYKCFTLVVSNCPLYNFCGGQRSGGQMSGGQKSGGQMSGGQMSGGQLSGGQMSGGQLSGGQLSYNRH